MSIFLLIWQVLAVYLNKSLILPEPGLVFRVLGSLLLQTSTLGAALQTAWKVLLALGLVLVLGILLGLLLGLAKGLQDMSRPIIMVLQAVPVISWLSLVIFTWGISWQGPVFIAFLSLLPTAILTTIVGVQNLDSNLLEMARIYRVPRSRVIREIYVGSLLPFIIAVVDVSLGQAWKVILVAEFLCGDRGLGVQIAWARQYFDIPNVYAFTLLAVILGLLTERIIKYYLGRISKRWVLT
ncbi:MAG TPA: ABC transporter permease subunit [Syntrophomonadaceae bacterium]|nr:ABC transporter permease subunit [Syntrophomonadaceae bacterium]